MRKSWMRDAGDLPKAHECALSSICSIINRFSGRRFEKTSASIEGRMSLTAQFIQGIDICEVSIAEGLYAQAAALLKQQLETIAAIDEFENNRRKEGKTPNIGKGVTKNFGSIYGDLNGIAHVSRQGFARQLVAIEKGELCAPSLTPKYNAELSQLLYGYHVYFIVEVGRQVERIFMEALDERFSSREVSLHLFAMAVLMREKVIELPPEIKERFSIFDLNKVYKDFLGEVPAR
ncbi:hypothetical protein DSM14862_01979 [Sulfitobacter indolifex]|nr:hypothetical protein DSM14862_01979 [Sulfitobacter indolifex]